MKSRSAYLLTLGLALLTGCAGIPTSDVVYSLTSNGRSSSAMAVIDNRPDSEKVPRLKDSSTLYLGDQNFVPARIDILRERLAANLSHVSPPVIVHIDSFEFIIYDDTGHSGALSTGGDIPIFLPKQSTSIFVPQSVAVGIARSWTDRTVICAISGRANGQTFEVNEYKNVAPREIARGFDDVLTTAIDKAVEQIVAHGSSK